MLANNPQTDHLQLPILPWRNVNALWLAAMLYCLEYDKKTKLYLSSGQAHFPPKYFRSMVAWILRNTRPTAYVHTWDKTQGPGRGHSLPVLPGTSHGAECPCECQMLCASDSGSGWQPKSWGPCHPHGDPSGVPSSWFLPGLTWALTGISEVSKWMEDLSPSPHLLLCPSNNKQILNESTIHPNYTFKTTTAVT